MAIKLVRTTLMLCVLLTISVMYVFAQRGALIVQPKRVIYTRKGKDVENWKKTFTVRYPMIKGGSSEAAIKNILNTIDYWRVFEISREENLSGEDQSLEGFDYRVLYNKFDILDISLTSETAGAYPQTSTQYFVFDIRSGRRLEAADLFDESSLPKLLNLIRRAVRRELAAHQRAKSLYQELQFESSGETPPIDKLEFKHLQGLTINDRGVTFLYDYGFPHVALALQPSGRFFFSWAMLRPYIRRDGLLVSFVR